MDQGDFCSIDLDAYEILQHVVALFPAELARRLRAIPLDEQGSKVIVATDHPELLGVQTREVRYRDDGRPLAILMHFDVLDPELRRRFGPKGVEVVLATKAAVNRSIEAHYPRCEP